MTACCLLMLLAFAGCKDDEDPAPADKEVTAVFTYSAEGNKITFVNASVNATSYQWTFGDGNSSSEKDPSHTYAAPGKYSVKLKASNPTFNNEVTIEVVTENAGPIASVIVGKKWMAVRGDALAIAMGPQTEDWTYSTPAGTWFSWGDITGAAAQLLTRESLSNDEYTFNVDGTYNVDFKGDFWGEFGIWQGIEGANEADIAIVAGKLPLNKDGDDVSAFVTGTWDWEVDEVNKTLAVKGAGAHILNPRYKNTQSSYTAGAGITYKVLKAVTGPVADTLVVYVETHDNDFNSDPREYHVLASYHGTAPDLKPLPEPLPIQFTSTVNAANVSHTFLAEDGAGTGVASIGSPYTVDFNANIGGKACTQLTKDNTEEDRYANYLFFAGTAGDPEVRSEIAFEGKTKVSLEVYIPSSNNFSGAFKNLVRIRFIDQSQYASFWEHYIQLEEADIATDTWVTLTFDFTDGLSAGAAETSPNSPDGVMIEFGEVNHIEGGTIYVRDFKLIDP